MITQEQLKQILNYDPDTGDFRWRTNTSNSFRKGLLAGTKSTYGYEKIRISKSEYYFSHRLAWYYIYGYIPENHIDHIDGDTSNNAIKNLREATSKENQRNSKLPKNNKSGIKGVRWNGHSWTVHITIDRKSKYLGSFHSKEEAEKVATKERKETFREFYKPIK